MGLLDLPAPVFEGIDQALGSFAPTWLRLVLWGILAGWLTMLVYRRLSNQEKIQALKSEQKTRQKAIADFDGELGELFPLIRSTLGLGLRQLGLSLGPALLATIPVLFLVVWVAGRFGHEQPSPGDMISITVSPAEITRAEVSWQPGMDVTPSDGGWTLRWPADGEHVQFMAAGQPLLTLPAQDPIPVIHRERWWNLLMANPIGYLPDASSIDAVTIGLPAQRILNFGPGWIQGWMFTFFTAFLLSSVAFKLLLKID